MADKPKGHRQRWQNTQRIRSSYDLVESDYIDQPFVREKRSKAHKPRKTASFDSTRAYH